MLRLRTYRESHPIRNHRHSKGARGCTPVSELCRKHGVSDASIYKRSAKFRGMDVSEGKRLKTLEDENTKRKRLLADAQCSTIAALKDLWKECMVRLVRARVRDIANDGSSCINIPASCEWAAVAARP